MAARVELATIKPSMLAHGFGMEESNDITLEDIIDAQGARPPCANCGGQPRADAAATFAAEGAGE